MKKLLTLAIIILINYTAFAQEYSLPGANDYYHPGKTVTAEGITFNVVSVSGCSISLRNINNWRSNMNPKYMDGTDIQDDLFGMPFKMESDPTDSIIINTFTMAEYNALKAAIPKQKLLVCMTIGNNGKILEITFNIFNLYKKLLQLPPKKYALLEKNFKKFAKFKLSDEYKNIQFVHAYNYLRFTNDYPIKKQGGATITTIEK